jgi:hypothetical protein
MAVQKMRGLVIIHLLGGTANFSRKKFFGSTRSCQPDQSLWCKLCPYLSGLNRHRMQFGNWALTEDSIEWQGNELQRFVIPKDSLTSIRYDKRGSFFYDWILKATDEDWLSQDDLYDLNFAFVHAAAKWGLEFSYETFDATLEEQYEQFDEEEDEDWNF